MATPRASQPVKKSIARNQASNTHHRYTVKDLDEAQHTYDLSERDDIYLHLVYGHNGIGSASCGPDVLPEYELRTEPFHFSVKLKPISLQNNSPAVLSRSE
nr:hypothetical protein [uncultured Allobacillus sp.]